ncbi:hypothetical protein [Curtobacterium sp. VKM Ac-2887]|uniref:hypothetical protein n=1 Tax=Curtobacterium sp. VKM Ac-2887 TaxID=2783819 RepID=UPI00188ACC28|nr:hypothetical protein [Curtobacterium sp. VKM Ac-2887]MBF4587955.1 hypothetical protein [Curtobacterium sp. VKM Ac-2887]
MAPSNRNTNRRSFGAALKRGWNSKPAGIAAIVVLVLVVIVVLISTLLGVFAPANNGGQGTAGKPAPTSSTSAAADGPCDVPTTGQAAQKVPTDITWHAGRGGITWPVSAAVGPTKKVDGFAACFARTRTGAALAATTGYLGQYDTGHSVRELLNFYIADSAGKATFVAQTVKGQTAPSDLRAQGISVAGYSVESFTKTTAVVDVVLTQPSGATGYFAVPITMTWTDTDWKMSVLDNGDLFSGNPLTPAEGDFTSWGDSDG